MYMLTKTESTSFVLLCSLCFQRQPFRFSFYFTAAGVKYYVVVLNIPIFHHTVNVILIFFLIIESILVFFFFFFFFFFFLFFFFCCFFFKISYALRNTTRTVIRDHVEN